MSILVYSLVYIGSLNRPKTTHIDIKKQLRIYLNCLIIRWSHLGLNQGPHDYESCALTN